VARTPPDRTLDWVLGVIGAGARIVESRTLHGDEPPWQLRIEHSSGKEAGLPASRQRILPKQTAGLQTNGWASHQHVAAALPPRLWVGLGGGVLARSANAEFVSQSTEEGDS